MMIDNGSFGIWQILKEFKIMQRYRALHQIRREPKVVVLGFGHNRRNSFNVDHDKS